LHRARYEHLARIRASCDARTDVDGDAGHLPVGELDLSGVQPGPDVQSERTHGLDDRARAPDRPRRPVEGREEAVARRVDLVPVEARELVANGRVVLLEEVAPPTIAELRGERCRPHEVREEDSRKRPIRPARLP